MMDGSALSVIFLKNCSNRRCNTRMSIVMENDHMIESICEHICQTLTLKISWRNCTYTCWSTVRPNSTVYVAIMWYNCKTLSSFVSPTKFVVKLLWSRWVFFPSKPWSEISIRFEVMHPGFIDSNYSWQKCHSFFFFVTRQIFLTQFFKRCFWARNNICDAHHTTTFSFIRYPVKMWCIIVFGIPDACSYSTLSFVCLRQVTWTQLQ